MFIRKLSSNRKAEYPNQTKHIVKVASQQFKFISLPRKLKKNLSWLSCES